MQTPFDFSNLTTSGCSRSIAHQVTPEQILLPQADITLYRSFFGTDTANEQFHALEQTLQWSQDEMQIAGKMIAIPRLQAWYSTNGLSYSYSGLKLNPLPFNHRLCQIKTSIEAATGHHFNSLLANLYRSGSDSVGWHSDNEPELGANPVIASLSLGETRRFLLKHRKQPRSKPFEISLHNGDLLVMAGGTQHFWLHQVPKSRLMLSPRINLTFRKICI